MESWRCKATQWNLEGHNGMPSMVGHPLGCHAEPTPARACPGIKATPHLYLQAAHPHLSILNLSSWQNQVLGLGSRSHAEQGA